MVYTQIRSFLKEPSHAGFHHTNYIFNATFYKHGLFTLKISQIFNGYPANIFPENFVCVLRLLHILSRIYTMKQTL